MSLVRWNPWREMEAMHDEMNRLFSRLSGVGGFNSGETDEASRRSGNVDVNSGQWLLPMDVLETSEALRLSTSLPGVDPKDVHIEVNDNILSVSAQRHYKDRGEEGGHRWIEQQYGTFVRSITLPKTADAEKIEARYNNGMLELTVPKRQSAQPRRIELQTAAPEPKAFEQSRTFESGAEQPSAPPASAEPAA